jgi:hypothetical protein
VRIRVTDLATGEVLAADTTVYDCFPGDHEWEERDRVARELAESGSSVCGGGAAPAIKLEALPSTEGR